MSLGSSVRALRRFAQENRTPRCDLCAEPLAEEHDHVVDRDGPALACACRACATLFAGTTSERYRRITPHVVPVDDAPTREEWDALGIPVGTVAVVIDSRDRRVTTLYPGHAGVVRGRVDHAAWDALAAARPSLALEPDVEALLVHAAPGEPAVFFRVGVDVCFRLVGLIRGSAGSADAQVNKLFAELGAVRGAA